MSLLKRLEFRFVSQSAIAILLTLSILTFSAQPMWPQEQQTLQAIPAAGTSLLRVLSSEPDRFEAEIGPLAVTKAKRTTSHTLILSYYLDHASRKWISSVSDLSREANGVEISRGEIGRFEYEAAQKGVGTWQIHATTKIAGNTLAYSTELASKGNPLLLGKRTSYGFPTGRGAKPYISDGVKYILRGVVVVYEHPDRKVYNLNPKEFRALVGHEFFHVQLSKNLQPLLRLPPQILGTAIGAIIGLLVGPDPVSKVALTFLGSVLGFLISSVSEAAISQYLLDEDGAVWVWLKKSDWDAIQQTARDYHRRIIQYLKIGDIDAVSFSIPIGVPRPVP